MRNLNSALALTAVLLAACKTDRITMYDPTAGIVRSRVSDGQTIDRIPLMFAATVVRASPNGSTLVAVQSNAAPSSLASVIDLRQLAAGTRTDPPRPR